MSIFDTMKYMPVKEYAARERMSLSAVYKKIRQKKLKHKKIGSYILVGT